MITVADIVAKTNAWATAQGYDPETVKTDSKYSDRALQLASIVRSNDFGCRRDALYELLDAITGERIPRRKILLPSPFKGTNPRFNETGIVVVPTGADTTNHGYAEGKPYFVSAVAKNGRARLQSDRDTKGSGWIDISEVRPATEAEIQVAYDAVMAVPQFIAGAPEVEE